MDSQRDSLPLQIPEKGCGVTQTFYVGTELTCHFLVKNGTLGC
jgi:hypothetical protein